MRTSISRLLLKRPDSLQQALQMLQDDPELTPIAGCTDVFVDVNHGTLKPRRFLNLWGLPELRYVRVEKNRLCIGALSTYTDLIRSDEVRQRLPILIAAARETGGVQIQNRGTLGGNVANASPAGDSLPVLAVAEADLILESARGRRVVPFNEFYAGYRNTVLQEDEIIVAIEVPPVEGKQWFRKVGTRAAQAISKTVMAAVRGKRPRVALGSVAPTVIRLPRTEQLLATGGSIEQAREMLESEIQAIDDVRSTARYRRQVSGNLLARFWQDTNPEPSN